MGEFIQTSYLRGIGRNLLLLVPCFILAGCATNAQQNQSAIAVRRAAVYKNGPAQGLPPDFEIGAGQLVKIRSQTLGYSFIETADGLTGYLLSDNLQIQAAPHVQPAIARRSARRIESNLNVPLPDSASEPADTPLFDMRDYGGVPMPEASIKFRVRPSTKN